MMKIEVESARVQISTKYSITGSVLAGTIQCRCEGMTTRLHVESKAPRERVAALIRNAEGGCYALAAVRNPVECALEVDLNGAAFDYTNAR